MAPHWKAPAVMTGSLTVAGLLAIGHDLYYRSLEGSVISASNDFAIGSWSELSPQKFHTSVGTAFAFLVRTFLVVAMATAYTQILWKALKCSTTKIEIVDSVTGALANPLALFDTSSWRRQPRLLCFACVAWVIPITSIFTPGALTVTTASSMTSANMTVPAVDFTSPNFATMPENTEGACLFEYTGPRLAVTQIIATVAAQGSIIASQAPNARPNASYAITFDGPGLHCNNVEPDLRTRILANINASMMASETSISYGFISWIPDPDDILPFTITSANNNSTISYTLKSSMLSSIKISGSGSDSGFGPFVLSNATAYSATTLYVAVLPGMQKVYLNQQSPSMNTTGATVIHCYLVNTTYSARFNWANGIRSIDLAIAPARNLVPSISVLSCDQVEASPSPSQSLLWKKTIGYQAIMDTFGHLLIGSIANQQASIGGLVFSGTSVLNTVLGNSPELAFLRQYALSSNGKGVYAGAANYPTSDENTSLGLQDSLVQLFQNITMSLMSSIMLQYPPSSPPPPTNVTFIDYHNVYAYSPFTLWIPYGIGVLTTTILSIAGAFAILSSSMSYSNSFSTILRTTSHARISTTISSLDAIGQDPLPKALAKALISFQDAGESKLKSTPASTPTARVRLLLGEEE